MYLKTCLVLYVMFTLGQSLPLPQNFEKRGKEKMYLFSSIFQILVCYLNWNFSKGKLFFIVSTHKMSKSIVIPGQGRSLVAVGPSIALDYPPTAWLQIAKDKIGWYKKLLLTLQLPF